jgi:hypothetical protein
MRDMKKRSNFTWRVPRMIVRFARPPSRCTWMIIDPACGV